MSAQTIINFTTDDGLASNVVNCLTVDNMNNLWFGTDAGISFHDPVSGEWLTLDSALGTGLVDDNITAIHVSPITGLWVGTDFGISNWDGAAFISYTDADEIGNLRIQWIDEDDEGKIYFANKDGFCTRDLDGDWTVFDQDNGLPFGGVKSIDVIEDDLVLLGLGLEGVMIYDIRDDLIAFHFQEDDILSNNVKSAYFDDISEILWIAGDNGLNAIYEDEDSGEIVIDAYPSVFELPPPHMVNQLTDVKVDENGVVWAGLHITYLVNVGGVSFLQGGEWTSLTVDDGLVGPVVNQLTIDQNNCVWVATSSGVSKISLQPSSTSDLGVETFSFYPNPVSDILTVTNAGHNPLDQLQVFDQLSRKVQISPHSNTFGIQLDVSSLAPGMYYLRSHKRTRKFIKQ